MRRITRLFCDPGVRERLHVLITGLGSLLVIGSLAMISACATCPGEAVSCPRIPIPYDPR